MKQKDNPSEKVTIYFTTGNSHIGEYESKLCDAAMLCYMLDHDILVYAYYVIWSTGSMIPRKPEHLGFSDNYNKWIKSPDKVNEIFYGVKPEPQLM